jgi:hypothetical protein
MQDQLEHNGCIGFKEEFGQKAKYQKTDIKELSYQSTRREAGNNVEIIKKSCSCAKCSKFMRGY